MGLIRYLKKKWKIPTPRALPLRAFGAKKAAYTWEDWQRDSKKKYPVRYFFQRTVTMWFSVHIAYPINNLLYWIRSHTYDRQHLIDLRDPKNGYKWGWIDRTEGILFASFRLLCDFVEDEMPNVSYYSPAQDGIPEYDRRPAEAEIKALYKWWTEERPKEYMDLYYDMPKDPNDAEWRCKDDIMLERLMAVRGYLWS